KGTGSRGTVPLIQEGGRMRLLPAFLLCALAAPRAGHAESVLQGLVDQARGGLFERVKELDSEGRIVERGGGVPAPPRDDIAESERLRIMEEIAANRAR